MSYFRPEIEQMAGYLPGEQPPSGKFIKLNTNENPYPPSPAVSRAIAAVLERGLARYPDPLGTAFRRRAGDVLGVDPDWILCGNGSDDILTIVTRALVGEGKWLRMPYPSYILYKTLAQLQGAVDTRLGHHRLAGAGGNRDQHAVAGEDLVERLFLHRVRLQVLGEKELLVELKLYLFCRRHAGRS